MSCYIINIRFIYWHLQVDSNCFGRTWDGKFHLGITWSYNHFHKDNRLANGWFQIHEWRPLDRFRKDEE